MKLCFREGWKITNTFKKPPRLSEKKLQDISRDLFSLEGEFFPLESYADQNVRLKTAKGQFVVKVVNIDETQSFLDWQNGLLKHIEEIAPAFGVPRIVMSKNNLETEMIEEGDDQYLIRVVTYLEGELFAKVKATPELFQNLGGFMARLNHYMASYKTPCPFREDNLWDLDNAFHFEQNVKNIEGETLRELLEPIFNNFKKNIFPKLKNLPKSTLHQDANEFNLIVNQDNSKEVTGIIDFGDATYGTRINELAITLAYAFMAEGDMLAHAKALIKGYTKVLPLEEEELEVLFDLAMIRLVVSICVSTEKAKEFPDNEYILVSREPAIKILKKLSQYNPGFLKAFARVAGGFPAHKLTLKTKTLIKEHKRHFSSLFPFDLTSSGRALISLKNGAPGMEFGDNPNAYWSWLKAKMDKEKALFAIGTYGEVRDCYSSESYNKEGQEQRSQHLGIDIFVEAGIEIFSPLDAKVHSIANNNTPLDYGPTVILEHELEGAKFYTLYGHLGKSCLEALKPGQTLNKGESFASVGEPEENGGWAPHLHFQIMVDMMGERGNFYGVGEASHFDVWSGLCLDPNLILGMEPESFVPDPSTPENLRKRRSQFMAPSLSLSYDDPLKIVRGDGAYLIDQKGRAFIDCVNNISHVGHSHPRITEAIASQSSVLNTNTRYLNDVRQDYAEKLLSKFLDPLNVVYFTCSGSEANELALRIARTVTRRREVITLDWAYHGNTQSCIEVSPYKFNRKGGLGKPDHIEVATLPDPYKGKFKGYAQKTGESYAQLLEENIKAIKSRTGEGPAAFIAESISGCGGQVVFPQGYFKKVFEFVRASGGLTIVDEVQVGFGRVGSSMWGFELQDVVPDIVTLGKPMGNGHPIAGVVTTREIADAFNNGMEYFNSFGGNPVSCKIGHTVLDIIENEQLMVKAKSTGDHFKRGLKKFALETPLIGDVRGEGMFLGVELVKDENTLEPATLEAGKIINLMKENGVLLSTDGPHNNVIKIKPPLVFGKREVDQVLEKLSIAFKRIENV